MLLACHSICVTLHAAPILIVDANGLLTGARGVTINNFYPQDAGPWDVDFLDGTCAQVFGVCDDSHFALHQFDNEAAWNALVATVFVDGPAGLFDSFPNLTLGCQGSNVVKCIAVTPDQTRPSVPIAHWVGAGAMNTLAVGSCLPIQQSCNSGEIGFLDIDLTDDPNRVWARWSRPSVPEPSIPALLGFAIAGIGIMRWKRRITN